MSKIAIIDTHLNELKMDYYNKDNFFTVGVERGALDLINKGIKLDLAISDFDHVTNEELDLIQKKAKKFIQLDTRKDELDGILAIKEVKKNKDIKSIKYICEPSERMDMNLSILQIMNDFDDITIFNEKTLIMKLKAGTNTIKFAPYQDYGIVSLFSCEDNKITIKHMNYEVKDLELKKFSTTAFSNEFEPYANAEITNEKDLLVIMTK